MAHTSDNPIPPMSRLEAEACLAAIMAELGKISERVRKAVSDSLEIDERAGTDGHFTRKLRTFLRQHYADIANDIGMTPDELLTLLENGGEA